MDEFSLIHRFFTRRPRRDDTLVGIGDDGALLSPPKGEAIVATMDTLVENVHFLPGLDPQDLGYKALAVNLSDLAAMGAQPGWAFLALTLPEVEERWLQCFAEGFFSLAEQFNVDLAGGDTTRGPLAITLQALGFVEEQLALRRTAAKPGDGIYVSGTLGSAGLGLKILQKEVGWSDPEAVERLLRPEPRVLLGMALRGLAHACIDISDGLAADLHHILDASGVGARIDWSHLPLTDSVQRYIAETGDWLMPLSAGDDYELCFTVPSEKEPMLGACLQNAGVAWHRIGTIEQQSGLRLDKGGEVTVLLPAGYQHFS